ncbi:MAG TPA: tetratricopeptide repeat protein, partial [Candidatus Bathyarchaeia archaeon]|nr:tetratricopeptide repeat protein [Candidatus Bathyarchaeia archaeon]
GIYSPLRTLFFSVNYHLWGDQPWGYHLVSLIVHSLGIWVAYRLLFLLTACRAMSFLGTLIFAVHPVHVESITYITATADTVGLVLLLLSFFYYVRSFGEKARAGLMNLPDGKSEGVDEKDYRLALIWGTAAMFTHELAMSLPFLIAFYDALFSPGRRSWKRVLKRVLPFFLVAAGYLVSKYVTLGGLTRGGYPFDAPLQTFLVVLKSWALYWWVMIFPWTLSHNRTISDGIFSFDETGFDRQAFLSQSLVDPQVLLSAILMLAFLVIAANRYRRTPLISFCIGWFYLSLLPVAQMIPSSVFYAERYLYVGSLGACCVFSYLAVQGLLSLKKRARPACAALVALMMLWIGFLAVRTLLRNRDYRNDIAYFESAVRESPTSSLMHDALGRAYLENNLPEKAVESFETAVALNPSNPELYFAMEPAYSAFNRFDDSERVLKKAMALDSQYAEAYYNLAGLLAYQGREQEGRAALGQAVDLWVKQGMILEAGEALEAFYLFLLDRKGELKKMSAKDLINGLTHE